MAPRVMRTIRWGKTFTSPLPIIWNGGTSRALSAESSDERVLQRQLVKHAPQLLHPAADEKTWLFRILINIIRQPAGLFRRRSRRRLHGRTAASR